MITLVLLYKYKILASALGLGEYYKTICTRMGEVNTRRTRVIYYLLFHATIFTINLFSFCFQRAAPHSSTIQLHVRLP